MVKKSTEDIFNQISTIVEDQVSYSLKWGMAKMIIEHVLGEGKQQDTEYGHIVHPSSPTVIDLDEDSGTVTSRSFDGTKSVLPEVDILPIYHVGMDDVLPTKEPYIPRVLQKVTFLVRPEGPIRIDRNFLMKLFSNESSDSATFTSPPSSISSSIELSLTEKRIRLMTFLEEELNRLGEQAQWLHEQFTDASDS